MLRAVAMVLLLAACFLPAVGQKRQLSQLQDAAEKAVKHSQWAQADSLYGAYHAAFAQSGQAKNFRYTEVLSQMVQVKVRLSQTDQAIRLQQELVEVRRTAPDCIDAQAASAICDLAGLYARKTDYEQAIATGQQGLSMLAQAFGTKHNYYAIALSNLAAYHYARGHVGDAEQAVAMGEQALQHIKKGTREYATLLDALVVYYSQTGQQQKADQMAAKALKEARKRLKEDGPSYATTLNNQSIRLARAGNYAEATRYAEQARRIFEESGSTATMAYARTLTNLATFCSHRQQYGQAIRLIEQALPVIERHVGRQHADYVRITSELSAAYRAQGDLDKADALAQQSDRLGRTIGRQDNYKYGKALSKQAATFASNGNYRRAIEQERSALDIFRMHADSTSMATSLGALAFYYSAAGFQLEAFSAAGEALAIFEQRHHCDQYYAQALNATSILYYNNRKTAQAADYARRAKAVYDQLGDTANALYARIMANMALFTFLADSTEQAIVTARHALRLHCQILGDDHPDNIIQLYNLAVFQSKAGRQHEAEADYARAMELLTRQVRTNFLHLTSDERENFWQQRTDICKFAAMLAYLDPDNPQAATLAYNAQLLTKGILLNSDIDFRSLLRRSGDEQLLAKYERLDALQQQLDAYYRLPARERGDAFRLARDSVYLLERDLVSGCKEYGSFTERLSIGTTHIAQALQPHEAAIEFASIHLEGIGTTYMALLLRKDRPAPLLIRLFSDHDLAQLTYHGHSFFQAMATERGISSIYDDARFGQMVWQPLLPHLQGITRIYFSPTDMLYQTGVEYLLCDDHTRIADRYELHRLSSTKALVSATPQGALRSAAVFGGLHYNMSRQQLAADSLRGSTHYLPGTLAEARNVGRLLQQQGISTQLFLEREGTEEAFKALSGRSCSLLHIATHGFSMRGERRGRRQDIVLFADDETDYRDNVLSRSGLLMAGADYSLDGGQLPPHVDDGVLTAYEIAQTDLSQTQLVVLSACQTALGEIRDDGVFGIQRGFKKAGAHTLLMSLWSISDEATALMMTRFYELLTQGHTIHQAFLLTQRSMRSEPRFSRPFFWASFVLLDAF